MVQPTKKTTTKKEAAPKPKITEKKLTVTLEKELLTELDAYLAESGFSKNAFVKQAILEKISRDKISGMIDSMIRL